MTIRNLEKKDAAAVALLIPQLTKNIVDPEKLAQRIEALTTAKDCQWLVAEKDNQVMGFGGLTWYVIPSKGLIAWIDELIVDEKFRGQGIATALMQQLLTIAQQQNIIQVKLTSTGTAASNLYEKVGFTKKDQQYFIKKLS